MRHFSTLFYYLFSFLLICAIYFVDLFSTSIIALSRIFVNNFYLIVEFFYTLCYYFYEVIIMSSDIGRKIRLRREELNMSQEELARLMNYKSRSSINKIEMGKTDVPRTKISEFAKVLKTTTAYLMGLDNELISPYSASNIIPLPDKNGRYVPLLGTIACGTPIMAAENTEKEILLPENTSADFCLRCKGDSMINARIFDGDIVFIKSQPSVENGEIAAVLIDDVADVSEATLKRVYIYEDKVILAAENPAFPPIAYSGREMDKVRIIGKAVAFFSAIK